MAASAQTPEAKAPTSPPQASAMDDALFYQLLLAEINLREGDAGTAYGLTLNGAIKTNDPRLYRRAIEIAQDERAGDAVLQAAQAWKAAQPTSSDANRVLLRVLSNLNRPGETLGPLRDELQLTTDADTRASLIAQIPRLYGRTTDRATVLKVVEQALQPELRNPATATVAWAVLGRLRLSNGQTAAAQEAATRVQSDSKPLPESAALLALELMEQKEASGEALMLSYLNGKPTAEFRMAYVRVLLQALRYVEAKRQLMLVVEQDPKLDSPWLILGSMQLQDRQLDEARESLQKYLSLVRRQSGTDMVQSPGEAQAYLYLSDIDLQKKEFAQAMNWLDRVAAPETVSGLHLRRANILYQQGKPEEARAAIHAMPVREPGDVRAKLMAEVQLLREARQYRAAFDLLAKSNISPAVDADVTYEQAMLAEKLDDLAGMERLLRSIIAAKPDYHAAYNALGYSMAEHNQRLPEAKRLIQKALEFAPNDPFISDSLGWVEFRLGNKADAARILEAAFQVRPDAEIGAHLGEVLWSLGQQDRAVEFWKHAQRLNPGNETLSETLKRLRVKW